MKVFEGYQVNVGRKRYFFTPDQADYYKVVDGLLVLKRDEPDQQVAIFHKWDALIFRYVEATV